MSSPYTADIEVSNTSNGTFTGEKPGDLVIRTATSNQSILIGAHEHSNAALAVRDNVVEVNATLLVNSVPIVEYVSSNVTVAAAQLPSASTTAMGIVQLSDSTSTTSSALAATSTAVKSAYDLAQSAHTLASMGGGGGGGTVTLDETETIYVGNVVPRSNVVYDLGTSNLRFRDLFLSGNTLDLGGMKIKGDSNVSVLNLGAVASGGSGAKYSIGPLANKAANSWSLVSQSQGNWRSVCWSPELSLFVAVGVSTTGATNSVMTSPNGVSWTLRSTPPATFSTTSDGQQWASVCWASSISKFVAVANGFVQNERVMTSSDGVTWTLQKAYNPVQDSNPWTSICAAPEIGLLVAVAANGTVMTSPDGITWTQRTPDVNFTNRCVCWSPDLKLFVIVSSSGDDRRVQTSPDGITWTSQHVPEYAWISVCWSPELYKFVAVSENAGYTMVSSDGFTWSAKVSSDNYTWQSVIWSPELRLLVAVADSNHVMTSTDGTSWTMRTSAPQGNWSCVSYSSELNAFLALGNNKAMITSPQLPAPLSTLVTNPYYLRMSSSNTLKVDSIDVGQALTVNAVPIAEHVSAGLVLDASRITLGTLSNARLLTASTSNPGIVQLDDSVASTSSTTAATSAAVKTTYDLASNALPRSGGTITGALTLNSNLFVSNHIIPTSNLAYDLGTSNMRFRDLFLSGNTIDLGGATIKTASNNSISLGGVNVQALNKRNRTNTGLATAAVSTWVARTSAADSLWLGVCWAPELSLFAAVANTGTGNRVMTSPDGITWTLRTSAADNNWSSVCWSPELSLFVAVANSGTGNRVMTSPDGITWTSRTSVVDNNWSSVCWAPELSLFAAVATSGTGNRVMTSPDGVTWTSRTSAADNTWRSACWAPELSLFVAVAQTGTGNRVMTSPDGITWTSRVSAVDNGWLSVCWAPELSLFAVVAGTGTGNRVMTSPDGITWTTRTSAADNNWSSVCWSPELSLFAAVAFSGIGNRVMTSRDGITWTSRTSAVDNSWSSVCWAPELSLFAAVSSTGTGNRVMATNPALPAAKSTLIVNPAFVSMSASNTLSAKSLDVDTLNAKSLSGTMSNVIIGPNVRLGIDESDPETISTLCNLSVVKNTLRGLPAGMLAAVEWATSVDGPGSTDSTSGVVVQGSNVYTMGLYSGSNTIVYNPSNVSSPFTLRTSTSNQSACYIMKSDTSGIAQWVATVDAAQQNGAATLAVDSQSNLYASFWYRVNGTIYNADGSSTVSLRTATSDAAAVVKMSPSGVAQSVVSLDATGAETFGSICVDSVDSLILTGRYAGSGATFYNPGNVASGVTMRATRGTAAFAAYVAKYNSNGDAQWASSIYNDTQFNTQSGRSVCTDKAGNIFWTGYYGGNTASNTILYEPNNVESSNVTIRRADAQFASYIVKSSSNGFAQWAASIDTGSNLIVQANGIAIDATSNLYIAGSYTGTPKIYNASNVLSSVTLPTASTTINAAFILKYDSNGQALWAASIDGTGADSATSVVVDSSGNPYIAGAYSGSVVIRNADGTSNTASLYNTALTSSANAGFTIKFSPTGTALWAAAVDGSLSDQNRSIDVDSNFHVYVAGQYRSSNSSALLTHGNNSNSAITLRPTTSNNNAACLVKYNQGSIPSYGLISDPATLTNGQVKYIINSSASAATINVRNSTNTTTLSTYSVNPGKMSTLVYYNDNWYN